MHAAEREAEEKGEAAAAAAEAAAERVGLGDEAEKEQEGRGASGANDEAHGDDASLEGHRRRRRGKVRGGRRWWPEEPVHLSGPALAVAAHPWAPDQIFAGSWGTVCLVEHR